MRKHYSLIFGNYIDPEFMQQRYDFADDAYRRAKLHRDDLVHKSELGDELETCCKAIDFYLKMKQEAKEYLNATHNTNRASQTY